MGKFFFEFINDPNHLTVHEQHTPDDNKLSEGTVSDRILPETPTSVATETIEIISISSGCSHSGRGMESQRFILGLVYLPFSCF